MDRARLLDQLGNDLVSLYQSVTLSKTDAHLSPALDSVILFVGRNPGVTIKQLSLMLRITSGATTQHVQALEDRGYVTRTHPEDDRRYSIVALTDQGSDAYTAIYENTKSVIEQTFAALDDASLQQLQRLIARLR